MIYFLIPFFNEAENLEILSKNLKKCLPEEKKYFVFVDDGSSDKSREVINSSFDTHEYMLLGGKINYGPGFAFNLGFEWILDHAQSEGDKIVTLESDNTSGLELLPKMNSICNAGFDLVLASVYAQGGGFDQTSFFRKLISFCANLMLRFIFDVKVLTLSSFYRIYRVNLVKVIKKQYGNVIEERGFISMIEILIKAIRMKATIIEVPMVLQSKARKGKSKMKKFRTALQYLLFVIKNKY